MTKEEIEKAAEDFALLMYPEGEYGLCYAERSAVRRGVRHGYNIANKHWQEKTRWKSLTTEPPIEFGEGKRILIKHKDSEVSLYLLYSDRSVEDALDMGFIEWKEID